MPLVRARATILILALILCGRAGAQDSTPGDWTRNPAMGNYKAYAEFKMGRYEKAREVWQMLAGLGNADALFNLAILAEDGLGEPPDLAKAEALYLAAAEAGGSKAQYRLGVLYSSGGALPRDLGRRAREVGQEITDRAQQASRRFGRQPSRWEVWFDSAPRFMLLMAGVIAIAMKIIGVLLITAMLIIPAATARRFASGPEQMALLASAIGVAAVAGGLFGSLQWDTPSGPSVVVVALMLFALSLVPLGYGMAGGGRKGEGHG